MMIPPSILPVFITGAYLFFVCSTYAHDSTQLVELERIKVTENKITTIVYERLDSSIISRPNESHSIDGLLTDLPGIDVKRSSPSAGKGRGVTLRGFDESRFIILLDGRPLNGSGVMGGHYVDWSSLSTDNITTVEVIRGPKSAEFGNSFGGVINIVSKEHRELPEKTTVTASYGVFSPEHSEDIHQNRKTSIAIFHRANINNLASLDLYASRGNGKPFLRNNYYSITNFGGNLSLYFPLEIVVRAGLRSSLQNRGFAIENRISSQDYNRNFPESDECAGGGPVLAWKGGDFYFGDRSYWNNIRTQSDISLSKRFQHLIVSSRLFINNQNRTEYFYAITNTNKLVLERFAKPEDYTWGWNVKAVQPIGVKNVLKYGVEGISLRYSNSDTRHIDTSYFKKQPSDGPDTTIKASDQFALYIQSELDFLERLALSPGLRYDYYRGNKRDETMKETPLHGLSPNAGVTLQTWKGSTVFVHGAYRYRFPTCPELYWYYNGHSFDGRIKILPERAVQFEAGIAQRLHPGNKVTIDVDVRGYRYNVYDYIRTVFGGSPVPPLKPKASRLIYNINNVTFTGIEADVKASIADHLNVRTNYTYQLTRKHGDLYDSSTTYSDGLPELPKHKANAAVDYQWHNSASAGLAMRYIGKREVIQESFSSSEATYRKVDSFITFRLFGMYPLYKSNNITSKVKLGIDNLFNTKYDEEPGIPMPGITGTTAIEINF